MARRDDFTTKVQTLLAKRVGFKCSAPMCRASTIGPGTDVTKSVSVGVACHVTAAAPGGPRYDPALTQEQRASVENGIWLCQTHAREIDVDPGRYPAQLLQKWREDAEREAQNAVGRAEQHVGTSATTQAKQAIAAAARLPDALVLLAEDIVGLPNGTIEHINRGVEYDRGRSDLVRKHGQRIRDVKRDAEDALATLSDSELGEQLDTLFRLEVRVRALIVAATVPRSSSYENSAEWAQLESVAASIRRKTV